MDYITVYVIRGSMIVFILVVKRFLIVRTAVPLSVVLNAFDELGTVMGVR